MLITLGIIGVVAAMTLPVITTNIQKSVTATKVKKIYAILQNATVRSIADNGDLETWYSEEMYNAGFASSYELYKKFIKPYYSITKECIDGSSNSTGYKNCGYKEDCLYTYDGTTCSISISNLKILLVLADGSVLAFRPEQVDLSSDNKGIFAYYWSVYYDENGPKQPNRFGRDIFIFALNPFLNKVVPVGLYQSLSNLQLSDKSDIDNNCITLGNSCSARILLDGWKIKY